MHIYTRPSNNRCVSEQAEISGETDMTTNVLLKAGEVLKSKTAAYTIGKQLQGTVWLAT
jgi:hypothetical protein